MTKLTLTYIRRENKVSAKNNKPYDSMSLKSTEYGDRYLSGFGSKDTDSWKEGDVVEVEVTESDKLDKNGKPYLNWSLPKKPSVGDEIAKVAFSVARAHKRIDDLVAELKKKFGDGLTSAGTPVPDFNPNTPEQAEDFANKMNEYEKNELGYEKGTFEDVNGDLNAIAEEEYSTL